MRVQKAHAEDGIWRVACTDMLGLDFSCKGRSPCLAKGIHEARRLCNSLDECKSISLNVDASWATLKRAHIWHKKPGKCKDIKRRGFTYDGGYLRCNTSTAREWAERECATSSGFHHVKCPPLSWVPTPANLHRPPLLLTYSDRGKPMLSTSIQSAPSWISMYHNIVQPRRSKVTKDWHALLRSKLVSLQSWLGKDEREDDTLVVVVDGSDVKWGGCLDFQQRYATLNSSKGIVFGAEFVCGEMYAPFPPGCAGLGLHLSSGTHGRWSTCLEPGMGTCSTPPQRRYLNAGGFAGSKRDIYQMLKHINTPSFQQCSRNRAGDSNDQSILSRFAHSYRTHARLDVRAELFVNMYRMKQRSIIATSDGHFMPAWDNRPACFVHNNGMRLSGASGWLW